MANPPSSATECRLMGTVDASGLGELLETLTALAGRKGGEFRSYEVVHRADGPPPVDVRLLRSLSASALAAEKLEGPRWVVRNETVLKRGPIRELPVTVLTVTEAECQGPDVPRFWEAMGTYLSRENVREGKLYKISAAGQKAQVTVSKLFRVTERDNPYAVEEVSPGHQLVEVKCTVPTGEHAAGSQALAEIQELLRNKVSLKKG